MLFVCGRCGNEPTPNASFCRHCGAPLAIDSASVGQQTPMNSYGSAPAPPPPQSYPPPGQGMYNAPSPSYPPQQPPNPYYQAPHGWQQPGAAYPGQVNMAVWGPQPSPFAANRMPNPFMRWLSYFLDVIPMGFIHLIGMVPLVGNIIGGLLGICYMLFRDAAMGSSFGKQLIGNAIVSNDGMVPTRKQLIMRNIPLALPYLFLMIPLVGPIICLVIGIPVFLTEHIMALATGLRIGDRLAGTRVVEKAAPGYVAG